ncbi:MAG: VWA domain-containing protein [Alphaproteobacteria bacterium]|nr:VWA domain-containing protein [Alphaproteobacteria bacterium]
MSDQLSKTASSADIADFLQKVNSLAHVPRTSEGRLIFAMDATMSRQPTWDKALGIQGQMFVEAKKAGGLQVQLVYFRGFNECRASKWVADPEALGRLMSGVTVQGGNTQIGRVLDHIKKENAKSPVQAVIYVGDAQEERIDALCQMAGELAMLGTPLFMFQEGDDKAALTGFKELARLTRGAYYKLDENSPTVLAELLRAVAAYAAGGRKALSDKAKYGGAARLLLDQMG